MNEIQIEGFVNKLIKQTQKNSVEWFECESEDLRIMLRKISSYSRIIGGFESESNKHSKKTIVGKYTVNYYYDEDNSTEKQYIFLAIVDAYDVSKAIVFTEDEMTVETCNMLFDFYRKLELDVNKISNIMDTWFDD